MSVYIAVILCIIIYLALYAFAKKIKNRSVYLKNLPGPKPIFPFGNTLDFISGSTGSKWRSHRKVITPSFHFSILQQFVSIFDNVGDNLVSKLQKEVGKNSVQISRIVPLYTLDVICEAAMGVKIDALNKENSKYIKSVKDVCRIIIHRTFSSLNPLFYPLTWNYYKEKKALKIIHELVEDIISKRMEEHELKRNGHPEEFENSGPKKKRLAFLDMLLEARIDGQPLTRRELRDEVNTFMFEGYDTVSSAITFCLLMLATNPDVQEKVFKEQRELFGNNTKTATATYKELTKMKYLDLVIKETLRLFPPVPGFGRKFAKDLEFKGNLYPKGMSVMILPYGFHRNPAYFPDPERFIPERFLDTTGKRPFIYTPFSAGARNCIGQKFAMLEMLSTISKIVRHFELTPAKPEHKIQLVPETILVSKTGVNISLKHRLHEKNEF